MRKENALSLAEGRIEVITGPMYAGKTDELLRRLKRWEYAGIEAIIFKPLKDIRTSKEVIKSRSGLIAKAISVANANEILEKLIELKIKYHVVAIDEAQFFDKNIIEVVNFLAQQGIIVLVAGLNCDYLGRPFGSMPILLAIADVITKLSSICIDCGADGSLTQRLINGKADNFELELIKIGDTELYSARCRDCFIFPKKENTVLEKKFKNN